MWNKFKNDEQLLKTGLSGQTLYPLAVAIGDFGPCTGHPPRERLPDSDPIVRRGRTGRAGRAKNQE
jgi:hypothetical protein